MRCSAHMHPRSGVCAESFSASPAAIACSVGASSSAWSEGFECRCQCSSGDESPEARLGLQLAASTRSQCHPFNLVTSILFFERPRSARPTSMFSAKAAFEGDGMGCAKTSSIVQILLDAIRDSNGIFFSGYAAVHVTTAGALWFHSLLFFGALLRCFHASYGSLTCLRQAYRRGIPSPLALD